jgi:hypothetical protein
LDLQKQIKTLMIQNPGMQDPWHYVGDADTGLGTTFGSGWGNRGAPWANLAFRKVQPNSVEVIGGITPGGSGSLVFTLPVGYAPVSQQSLMYFTIAGNTSSVSNAPIFNVLTTGAINQNGGATVGASAGWVHDTFSLDV